METRYREYNKLKKTLLDIGCYEADMDLQCMRDLLNDLQLVDLNDETNYLESAIQQDDNELLSMPLQIVRGSAKKNWTRPGINWSPLWLRDETSRLKRKDKPTSNSEEAHTINSTKSSTSWQRVEYGCVQNKRNDTIPSQNGCNVNSTMLKGYQAATRPLVTFCPTDQIPDDVSKTNVTKRPNLVRVNCSPIECDQQKTIDMHKKNSRTLNSTLKNSFQADDGCQTTLPNSNMSKSAYGSPLWSRDESRRLERRHYITDFNVTSFYKKQNVSMQRNGDSVQETAEPFSSNSTTNTKLNLQMTNNSANVNSNLTFYYSNNDKDDVDRMHFSNSSADLTDNHYNSVYNLSSSKESEESYDINNDLSNNISICDDVDRSQTISFTSSLSENSSNSFSIDDKDSNCLENISQLSNNGCEKMADDPYNFITYNENSNNYLSTLYEVKHEYIDDYN